MKKRQIRIEYKGLYQLKKGKDYCFFDIVTEEAVKQTLNHVFEKLTLGVREHYVDILDENKVFMPYAHSLEFVTNDADVLAVGQIISTFLYKVTKIKNFFYECEDFSLEIRVQEFD